ncbi:thermonuclease family protein [Paenibacillus hexagrammi]|uniref:Thermonuclease family protein n=1 Tax=Paenibacillus hexagrammi TaxID=2908839 RepID=A0ABY3SQ59_9BACL|nr:thermonuclease family protein [Paenibacillus sp. YPD9-1]UJF35260.1 thermonuclease family protein [Paenibacillus sp. YPD9-1]
MKSYLHPVLLILLILTGCSTHLDSQTSSPKDEFVRQILKNYPELKQKSVSTDTVKRVIDGDTFETNAGEKVRLIGVNTPEVYGEVQYYGREASDYSKKQLSNQAVYLFSDVGNTDKYGRLLRYVFMKNNPVMFNEILLMEGYANTMSVPPNVTYAKKFAGLERLAREQNKGLWSGPVTSPSPTPSCKEPKIKGNINARNEKIYHVPGGRYYDQTHAEMMFCTEEDAVAQGFRKSSQ